MFNGQSLDRLIDLTQQRLLLGLRLLLQRGQAGAGVGTGGDRWDTVGHHVHHLPQIVTLSIFMLDSKFRFSHTPLNVFNIWQFSLVIYVFE